MTLRKIKIDTVKLAQAMVQPLRKREYMAVGRKAFTVERLPEGVLRVMDINEL
jgi:hypothetical protein